MRDRQTDQNYKRGLLLVNLAKKVRLSISDIGLNLVSNPSPPRQKKSDFVDFNSFFYRNYTIDISGGQNKVWRNFLENYRVSNKN